MNRLRWAFVVAVFVPVVSFAQITSTVEGTVVDKQGLAIVGAEVRLVSDTLATDRKVVTDKTGFYQISPLPAGTYTMTVTATGFRQSVLKNLEITLNRTLSLKVNMEVGAAQEVIEVQGSLPLLETQTSSAGATILPRQIQDLPINGRNYLDLLQLVPGVAIKREQDQGADSSTPVLGERAGNTNFLIDGLPNRNDLNGGPASQFNQETISEFQVITTGYKAEFGNASGGVVNVITKSGTNAIHGMVSGFHRNSAFDTSNITGKDVPSLLRWDYSVAAGGRLLKDKAFWFASAERIDERRQLNFVAPSTTPQVILDQEIAYDTPRLDKETRLFGRLDQNWKRHQFREQVNYTNAHINNSLPLSASTNLPSSRRTFGDRNLMLGFSDTWLAGEAASPFVLNFRGQFRRQPSINAPAHPQAGPLTAFNIFSGFSTGNLFGDLGGVTYGSNLGAGTIDQTYGNATVSVEKNFGKHTFKMGWDYVRTIVDGREVAQLTDQLFATLDDYATFGPLYSGMFTVTSVAGAPPNGDRIRLRNNYNGLFFQDDWKLLNNLTLNLGVRWDYDSRFAKTDKVSPRLGFAWAARPTTIVRGSFGYFYDHFRIGIARDVPGFGGADMRLDQPLSFPRLFYGVPTTAPGLFGLCLSPTETDAQLAASGTGCTNPFLPPGGTVYGVDHLNSIVAPSHAPIPSNVVVTVDNVQSLSGLDPQTFADQASIAIGQAPGFWSWGPFGALSFPLLLPAAFPSTVDPSFDTPYTRSFSLGIQHQLTSDFVISLDYYHKDIRNMLGVRDTDLPFEARVSFAPSTVFVNGYGPWYSGRYNAGVLSVNKRFSHRFAIGGSYTWASATDDAFCANFDSSAAATCTYPTDSFRGIPPVVTDPITGETNANGSFIAFGGLIPGAANFVPKAGVYYDGATLDKGPSDLFLRHTFELHGTVELPWKVELSSLFRAQSGFRYTQSAQRPVDQDGNGNFGPRDLKTARNQFLAPHFVNMDLRIARKFKIGERASIEGLFEFFNLFNAANPAAVQAQAGATPAFGTVTQRLDGREGQVGLRITF